MRVGTPPAAESWSRSQILRLLQYQSKCLHPACLAAQIALALTTNVVHTLSCIALKHFIMMTT